MTREDLRATLAGRLERSPLDFIREMDPTGDRAVWLDQLTRPLAPELDLTAVVSTPGLGPVAVIAEILPWDTEFFGFVVARLDAALRLHEPAYQILGDLGSAIDRLLELCRERGVRFIFSPVDARDAALARALGSRGFEFVESRLYYHRPLADFAYSERYDTRLANEDDVEPLSEVAATTVNPYDRFHSDPALSGAVVDRLMRRWVRASICEGFADAVLVPNVARPEAFLTIKYHKESWHRWGRAVSQAPFGAVGPGCRGWYVKLISEICHHLRDLGAEHFFMISQATNNAVVRCWEKLGMRYGKNVLVFRRVLA